MEVVGQRGFTIINIFVHICVYISQNIISAVKIIDGVDLWVVSLGGYGINHSGFKLQINTQNASTRERALGAGN